MFIYRNIPAKIILRFAYKNLIYFIIWSTCCVLSYDYLKSYGINFMIPFAPISLIGIAVSFYLGFKNNQSYDRFWEARTIWGSIVNNSRHWGNMVLTYLEKSSKEKKKELIYRHLAYINALRLQLRRPTTFSQEYKGALQNYHFGSTESKNWDEEVRIFIDSKEFEALSKKQNFATHTLRLQSDSLLQELRTDNLNNFEHIEMMNCLKDFYADQGKCERIKNTPFPRQYAYFSKVFVWAFVLLLPLALIGEFQKSFQNTLWVVVPFSTLISWIFLTIEIVGDNSEDPFENFINDVPMTALCRTIEIDLRDMLHETDLPPRILPENGILM